MDTAICHRQGKAALDQTITTSSFGITCTGYGTVC